MHIIKAYLDTPLVWWLGVLGAIAVMSMLLWSVLDNPSVVDEGVDEIALEAPVETVAEDVVTENASTQTSYIYWPEADTSELLSDEGEVILQTARIYLSERDQGSWSYVFDRYDYPFALVTVEDDEQGSEFNFELLLKDIDNVWSVIYETSAVGETPPQDIIDLYDVPVITELN